MTTQLKADIKTILEVISFIFIWVAISNIANNLSWVSYLIASIGAAVIIYNSYFKRYRKDVFLFPTLNDEYSKMTFITFGILIILFSAFGRFLFNSNLYYSILGFAFGAGVILFGIFQSPKGWISVEKCILSLYGVKDKIDTRQLKDITLSNDKIVLTNIYGEHTVSFNLKLNPKMAKSTKKFLEEKLQNEVQIIDNVFVEE